MSVKYIQTQVRPNRPATWYIKDDDHDRTLCGHELEVKISQTEMPITGMCPRCLSVQLLRKQQARGGQRSCE